MAGAFQRALRYLGLVEEDDLEDAGSTRDRTPARTRERARERPGRRSSATAPRSRPEPVIRVPPPPEEPETEGMVRTIPQARPQTGAIHRAEPHRFNEARELGDKYKEGVPVIMNLQQTEDSIARRLVDFASGLVFALDGKIELVANRVYLLSPQDVEVSAEERERLREGGFFNQF